MQTHLAEAQVALPPVHKEPQWFGLYMFEARQDGDAMRIRIQPGVYERLAALADDGWTITAHAMGSDENQMKSTWNGVEWSAWVYD